MPFIVAGEWRINGILMSKEGDIKRAFQTE
jgi:hypothetical protein